MAGYGEEEPAEDRPHPQEEESSLETGVLFLFHYGFGACVFSLVISELSHISKSVKMGGF